MRIMHDTRPYCKAIYDLIDSTDFVKCFCEDPSSCLLSPGTPCVPLDPSRVIPYLHNENGGSTREYNLLIRLQTLERVTVTARNDIENMKAQQSFINTALKSIQNFWMNLSLPVLGSEFSCL
jgi:hypothetical protein